MRIVVGGIYQETNTFTPIKATYDDFVRLRGSELVNELAACSYLEGEGVEVVPAVYARVIPSGCMSSAEFDRFMVEFFAALEGIVDVDGIWLFLHGAMWVDGAGSGEVLLLRKLRERFGDGPLISCALDFHANVSEELASLSNIVTGYRTAPHVDEEETGVRAAQLLVESLRKGLRPSTRVVRVPMVLPGEMVITNDEPARSVIGYLNGTIDRQQILDASMFCGFCWADTPLVSASITVSSSADQGTELACRGAQLLWERRGDFHYSVETGDAETAVSLAAADTGRQVFISDAGDNVTAGAAGDSAYLAARMLAKGMDRALVGGIADEAAVDLLWGKKLGETVELDLGGTLSAASERIHIKGVLRGKSEMEHWRLPQAMRIAVVRCGGMDILINRSRFSFTAPEDYAAAKVDLAGYRTVAIKLGYLYPELEQLHARSILAMTPGDADQDLARLNYTAVPQPLFPVDPDAQFSCG